MRLYMSRRGPGISFGVLGTLIVGAVAVSLYALAIGAAVAVGAAVFVLQLIRSVARRTQPSPRSPWETSLPTRERTHDPDYWPGKWAGAARPTSAVAAPARLIAKPTDPPGPRLWVPRSFLD